MDVLQTALSVVARSDPQIVAILGVPRLGQILDLGCPGQNLALQLEAHKDVEVIGQFIRSDPDIGRFDLVDHAVEIVESHTIDPRESRFKLGEEEGPEGKRSPDDVLPQTALALVYGERDSSRERGSVPSRRRALLVETVAHLVQRR